MNTQKFLFSLVLFLLVACENFPESSLPEFDNNAPTLPDAEAHETNNTSPAISIDSAVDDQSFITESDSEITDQPIGNDWEAKYSLPEPWHINLDLPNKAMLMKPNGVNNYLDINLVGASSSLYQLKVEAEFFRDSLSPCVSSIDTGVGRNCSYQEKIYKTYLLSFDAVVFRYYGTWMSRDQEVNEIFLEWNGNIIHLSLQGSLDEDRAALEQMLQELEMKPADPSPGPALEEDEKGL